MIEERKYPRKIAKTHISMYDCESQKNVGCLIDLTVGGMRIMCECEIEPETMKTFNIKLPFNINDKSELMISARTVYCNVGSDPGFYSIGFEFDDIDDETIDILSQLLESDAFDKVASFSLL